MKWVGTWRGWDRFGECKFHPSAQAELLVQQWGCSFRADATLQKAGTNFLPGLR